MLLVEMVLLAIVPVVGILSSKALFKKRLYILAAVFIAILALAVFKKIPQEVLGFHAVTSTQLLWYIGATAVGSVLLWFGDKCFKIRNQRIDTDVLLSSPLLAFAQQFIFFAYFLNMFLAQYPLFASLIAAAALFAVMHLTLEMSFQSLGVSFLSGLYLAAVFLAMPNLYLATVMHSLLNIQALKYRIPGIGPSIRKLR
jgi:hypothetical protein